MSALVRSIRSEDPLGLGMKLLAPTPAPPPAPELERIGPEVATRSAAGGLIAITGPPLSGKQSLGESLEAVLPEAIHLSQIDPLLADLQDEEPQPLRQLVARGRSELRCGRRVVLSARLDTLDARAQVASLARETSAQHLLVELEGTDPATLERAGEVAGTREEIQRLFEELKEQLERYRELRRDRELRRGSRARRLPTLELSASLPLEDQVQSVLSGWGRLGALR